MRGDIPLCKPYRYAAMNGMVFKQFSLGYGIEISEFWSRVGYD